MISLLRPFDWLILALGAALVALLAAAHPASGDRVVIKQAGRTFLDAGLRLDRLVRVPGPLGDTLVEIRAGRVRVQADPSPRQHCVRQGWLAPGEAAVCLPNRVSVERGANAYDSLNY